MPFTVTMPKLSPTMEEGVIAKWHKKVGDHVEAGDLLLEVSTDKATVEYNALDSGWLRQILIKDGEGATVNQPIAVFTEEKNESIEGFKVPTPTKPKAAPEPVQVAASQAQPMVAQPVPRVAATQPTFVPETPLQNYRFEHPISASEKRVSASPLAKKLAKEKGLDLSTVKGTGPHERIVSRDLEYAQPTGTVVFGGRAAPTVAPGTFEEEPLSPMRKVIAQRLQESKSFVPHFYTQQVIDVQALVALREQLGDHEIKLSFNDFILRATALALRDHPNINSGFNSVNQTIIRFKTIDISVAVNVEAGLITPIVRHADYKNIGEIAVEVRALSARAREGKLAPEEYKGGSFTVSNMGMFGITDFQAIINPPQAAILAVSGIQDAPVVKNGAVVPGKIMHLSLSADHRVIDGVAAAKFMQTLKGYLESPAILII